jgi:hypothetical protein
MVDCTRFYKIISVQTGIAIVGFFVQWHCTSWYKNIKRFVVVFVLKVGHL